MVGEQHASTTDSSSEDWRNIGLNPSRSMGIRQMISVRGAASIPQGGEISINKALTLRQARGVEGQPWWKSLFIRGFPLD
ncbi:hypothetical protein GCM10023155_19340 [Bremerella cremea]